MLVEALPLDLRVIKLKTAFDARAKTRNQGGETTAAEERTRREISLREWRERLEKDERATTNRTVETILSMLER